MKELNLAATNSAAQWQPSSSGMEESGAKAPSSAATPSVLDESCFVCPNGSSPDDYIDYSALWRSLGELASVPRLSSTITAQQLAEAFALDRFFTRSGCPDDAGAGNDTADQAPSSSGLIGRLKRSADHPQRSGDAVQLTAVRHAGVELVRHPERGREFLCTAQGGLEAGTCVLVEQPAVNVLDSEVQREKEWWDVDGADTCSLLCAWMLQLLREVTNPSLDAGGYVSDRRRHAVSRLYRITENLHPAAPAGGSSEAEWKELYESLPKDVQKLVDEFVNTFGGSGDVSGGGGGFSQCRVDLPVVWKRLQLNQMGSYTHPEHVAGAYERTWRYFTGTGLYPWTSLAFNHSCLPNVMRVSVGPLMVFRTSRPVAKGDALTISYVGTDLLREPLEVRVGEDEDEGGGLGDRDFTCACPLCVAERETAGAEGEVTGRERVAKVTVAMRARLRLSSAQEREEMLRRWLMGSGLLEASEEDDEAEDEDAGEGEGGARTAMGASEDGADLVRLSHRDELELSLQLVFALLEVLLYMGGCL